MARFSWFDPPFSKSVANFSSSSIADDRYACFGVRRSRISYLVWQAERRVWDHDGRCREIHDTTRHDLLSFHVMCSADPTPSFSKWCNSNLLQWNFEKTNEPSKLVAFLRRILWDNPFANKPLMTGLVCRTWPVQQCRWTSLQHCTQALIIHSFGTGLLWKTDSLFCKRFMFEPFICKRASLFTMTLLFNFVWYELHRLDSFLDVPGGLHQKLPIRMGLLIDTYPLAIRRCYSPVRGRWDSKWSSECKTKS